MKTNSISLKILLSFILFSFTITFSPLDFIDAEEYEYNTNLDTFFFSPIQSSENLRNDLLEQAKSQNGFTSQPSSTFVNSSPYVDDVEFSTDSVTPITLTITGSDPDLDYLTYFIHVEPTLGTVSDFTYIDDTTATILYTPFSDSDGVDTFYISGNDCTDFGTFGRIDVTITPIVIPNTKPNADAETGTPKLIDANTVSTLSGTGSSDENGDAISYLWEVYNPGEHTIIITNPTQQTASFTAPDVTQQTYIQFKLIVTETSTNPQLSDSDVVGIYVRPIVSSPDPVLVIQSPIANSDKFGNSISFVGPENNSNKILISTIGSHIVNPIRPDILSAMIPLGFDDYDISEIQIAIGSESAVILSNDDAVLLEIDKIGCTINII